MLHINTARVSGPHRLIVEFSTGEKREVYLKPLLKGPVFKPLLDEGYFGLVKVDPECRTVVWPNGADLAPECIYELASTISEGKARNIQISDGELRVDLTDGRKISAPLKWYPRLFYGSPSERARWELIGGGIGIHWPKLDEDISVEGLLEGRRSRESKQSLKRWLDSRREKPGKRRRISPVRKAA